ncbi:MAG TPA: translation initiation factor 2 [Vitreimonas sp.]|uniref:translation initiation factor 2 n=1 Tax=Vitreimonas sp. TaxID=3069702 RepID=UPI002D47A059|nr:translation initiation factor 2 [Vitreimonas sp.]HYD86712.1 translation initiation factor 2 [Vitreimonas sp.]
MTTLALVLSAAATGCATITRGTAQDFTVESTPSGAAIETSNGFQCSATPCTFRMQRKHGFTVTATLDGYLPAQATVQSEFSTAGGAGMAGNVLIGGLIGVGVDATSGATNDLRPNPLHLALTPVPPPAEATVVSLPADAAATADAPAASPEAEAPAEAAPAEAAAPAPAN